MEWIYWLPPVLLFAFAWHTWTYGWNKHLLTYIGLAVLAGLVAQWLIFAD